MGETMALIPVASMRTIRGWPVNIWQNEQLDLQAFNTVLLWN